MGRSPRPWGTGERAARLGRPRSPLLGLRSPGPVSRLRPTGVASQDLSPGARAARLADSPASSCSLERYFQVPRLQDLPFRPPGSAWSTATAGGRKPFGGLGSRSCPRALAGETRARALALLPHSAWKTGVNALLRWLGARLAWVVGTCRGRGSSLSEPRRPDSLPGAA